MLTTYSYECLRCGQSSPWFAWEWRARLWGWWHQRSHSPTPTPDDEKEV